MTMNTTREVVEVSRDIPATTVPYGETTTLPAGETVTIVQNLGGSVTVRTPFGVLLRIDGENTDAIGIEREIPERAVDLHGKGPLSMDQVTNALQTVYDPEIPISIVELGLIYRLEEVTDDDGSRVIEIDMTMTSPGCGMGDVICGDAERAVRGVPGVDDVEVNLVFDPPWDMSRMSEATRLELGLL